MASYICVWCREIAFEFERDMRVDRAPQEILNGHEYYLVAKGNSIEGVEAK